MSLPSRHEERERALSLLYEARMKAVAPDALLGQLPVAPSPYTAELVRGVGRDEVRLDTVLSRFVTGWALDRVAVLDLLVLRLATFELESHHEVPGAVVIDEAVELAKTYSTEDSGRFVNGVLSSIARDLGRLPAPHGSPEPPAVAGG